MKSAPFRVLQSAATRSRSNKSDRRRSTSDSTTSPQVGNRLATFPGAPVGEYRLELTDGSRTERALFDVETALERGLSLRHFNFDTYDEDFALNGNAVTANEVLFGFVGYEPNQSADLLLYRSPSTSGGALLGGPYELTGDVAIEVDDRGEAVVAIALDDSASGHCFRFDTVATLATEIARGGTADAVGNDPTLFCVPSGAAGN